MVFRSAFATCFRIPKMDVISQIQRLDIGSTSETRQWWRYSLTLLIPCIFWGVNRWMRAAFGSSIPGHCHLWTEVTRLRFRHRVAVANQLQIHHLVYHQYISILIINRQHFFSHMHWRLEISKMMRFSLLIYYMIFIIYSLPPNQCTIQIWALDKLHQRQTLWPTHWFSFYPF